MHNLVKVVTMSMVDDNMATHISKAIAGDLLMGNLLSTEALMMHNSPFINVF